MSQQINLFNPIFLKQKKHFSSVAVLQALALIAAGTLAFSGFAAYKVRALVKIAADSEKQLGAQRTQLAGLAKEFAPQGRSAALAEELARAEARVNGRRELLNSLQAGELGNVQGFSKYLAAFARQSTEGVWLTGIAVGGDENDLVVRGRVLRPELVPTYLRALNREEVMRGRRVVELSLSASDEAKGSVSAGQAGAGAPQPAAAGRPTRYVEFSLVAPRTIAAAPKSAPAGGAQPKGSPS